MDAHRQRHLDLLHLAVPAIVLVALLTAVLIRHGGPLTLDVALDRVLDRYRSPDGQTVAAALTQLGSGAVLYPLLALLAAWRRTTSALVPLAVLAAGQVLETVLLSTLHRSGMPVSDAGFSSGHTATAALGWGLVVLGLDARRRTAVAVALLAGVVVRATRAYLGLHWLSDVVAGRRSGCCSCWPRSRSSPVSRRGPA